MPRIISLFEKSWELLPHSISYRNIDKFPDYVSNGYRTHNEDMPDQFQKPEWDDITSKNGHIPSATIQVR